jgi:tol-pal system protein YbgF
MNTSSPGVHLARYIHILPFLLVTIALVSFGCGPSQESTEDWETTPIVSPTAKLEYKIDSLSNENRKLHEQVDAVATENRSLRERVAELESKLAEATAAPKLPPPPVDMRAGYTAALDQFNARNYDGAITQFQSLLQAGIGEDLADNCHYWIGESYYALGKYTEAIGEFRSVLNYKDSGKRPYAELMLGNTYAAQGNNAAAKEAFNTLINSYPASSLVTKAQEKLARLK